MTEEVVIICIIFLESKRFVTAKKKDLLSQVFFQLNPPLRVGEIFFDDEIQLRWVKSASTADGWI